MTSNLQTPAVQLTSTRALGLSTQQFTGFKTSAPEILGDNTAEPISCTAYTHSGATAVISSLDPNGYHLLSPNGQVIHTHLTTTYVDITTHNADIITLTNGMSSNYTSIASLLTNYSALLATTGALQSALTALTTRVTALEAGGGNSDTGSLSQQKYDGYYADSVSFFDTATQNGASTTVTAISIGDEGSSYSYKWYGTWTPHVSGTWEFKTQSDDAAHVYIMASGQSPGDSGTLVVDNGGTHGANVTTGSYVVSTAGTVYTIHIYHGEATGGAQMDFWYKIPSNSYSQDLTKLGFFQP